VERLEHETAAAGVDDLARELAWQPEIIRRLLARHVPDGGGRCRGCTIPGTGLPGGRWPCVLHFYAEAAARIARWHGIDVGSAVEPTS
jgi:hypothetical protein